MKQTFLAIAFFLLPAMVAAQYIPVLNKGQETLWLDLDALWRYNLYEHSRWGAGLRYTRGDSLTLTVNAGYGVVDRQWKGSVGGSVMLPCSHREGTLYGVLARDYLAAGNRQMEGWRLTDIGSLSSLMDRRMSDQLSALAGYRWRNLAWRYAVDARFFASQRLYAGDRMLYLVAGDTLYREQGIELRFLASSASGFSTQWLCGSVWPGTTTGNGGPRLVIQALAQWERSIYTGPLTLDLYLQGGAVPPGVPYPYLFDLGGTWGVPLHFRHTLLTVRPNEFTASAFIFLSIRYGWRDPLFRLWSSLLQLGSCPRPFVGVNATWGHLWGQSPEGQLTWEGMELQSPHHGLTEAVAGVEGLVRWGLVDWGAAVAYRLALPSAPYHLTSPRNNLALLVTAKLTF